MGDTWTQVLLVLLPVVVGAVIGALPTMLVERARARAALLTRWDEALHTSCAQFAAGTRRIIDLAEGDEHDLRAGQGTADADPSVLRQRLDDEHRQLQILMAEIRIIGGPSVQLAARNVVRDAWALAVEAVSGVDPRAADYPDVSPRARTLSSLFEFYHAARQQLRVPEADTVVAMNPPLPARSNTDG